jgi:hypothetical protein
MFTRNKQYFRATINIGPNAEQLCIQGLAKSVVTQEKDAAKSKHRFESPNGAQRVEGHSYDCTLAV